MKYLLLFTLFLAACGSDDAPQKLEWTEMPAGAARDRVITEVAKGAIQGFAQQVFENIAELKILTAEIDLHGDETPEIIAKIDHPASCNAYGCYIIFIEQIDKQPALGFFAISGFDIWYEAEKNDLNIRTLYVSYDDNKFYKLEGLNTDFGEPGYIPSDFEGF